MTRSNRRMRASMPGYGFWRRLVVANLPLTKPLLGLCFRGHAPTMALLRTTLSRHADERIGFRSAAADRR